MSFTSSHGETILLLGQLGFLPCQADIHQQAYTSAQVDNEPRKALLQ